MAQNTTSSEPNQNLKKEYNQLHSAKRSWLVYCHIVHKLDDITIIRETFNALRAKYESDLDFHVAIIEAYWLHINKM